MNNFTAAGRRYETIGGPFTVDDFLRCHDYTYPVQKGLFDQPQMLPCRLNGWTMYTDVAQDVCTIIARFGVAEASQEPDRRPQESPS
ncbi:hypothetical protein [Reyranella sp.]|uniref:hypothetical protein n=1 Tax=Reyranella sp. TaxID=1929291 RepID=UPI003BADB3A0